jgi:hypothetical protein
VRAGSRTRVVEASDLPSTVRQALERQAPVEQER